MPLQVTSIAALFVLFLTGRALAEPKVTVEKDLIYGRVFGAALAADVAWPETTELVPAVISVHGGRWVGGHKRDTSAIKVEQWAGFGFFAMSIDYRLRDCTPAPACYQDLQCAIRFVHANAEKYHVDPKRVFLIGQSAGGHLVTLAATLGDGPWSRTGGWEKASNDIAAAISVAACYDLPSLDWGKQWGPPGTESIAALEQASPNRQLSKDTKPLLILHSDDDRSVPIANALIMVEALKKAGTRHTFHHYTDLGHMQITQEVIDKSLAFIKEVSATAAK
jgi:acetyl esterase/lipase